MKVATDIARLFGIAQIYLYSVQYIIRQNDKKTTSESFYQGFPTQNFFDRKKSGTFFKTCLWDTKIPKNSKNGKKVKIDNFFSKDAYKWAVSQKSPFFNVSCL